MGNFFLSRVTQDRTGSPVKWVIQERRATWWVEDRDLFVGRYFARGTVTGRSGANQEGSWTSYERLDRWPSSRVRRRNGERKNEKRERERGREKESCADVSFLFAKHHLLVWNIAWLVKRSPAIFNGHAGNEKCGGEREEGRNLKEFTARVISPLDKPLAAWNLLTRRFVKITIFCFRSPSSYTLQIYYRQFSFTFVGNNSFIFHSF